MSHDPGKESLLKRVKPLQGKVVTIFPKIVFVIESNVQMAGQVSLSKFKEYTAK